eukprot:snap_masked-scaffold_39-processed-gene-0.0-mRNA-1 protein AED:0.59 eAED:0.61 QI:0/-1/0/1/-1/1/1/0/182
MSETTTTVFNVPTITCSACSKAIQNHLSTFNEIQVAKVNVPQKTLTLKSTNGISSRIPEILGQIGHKAEKSEAKSCTCSVGNACTCGGDCNCGANCTCSGCSNHCGASSADQKGCSAKAKGTCVCGDNCLCGDQCECDGCPGDSAVKKLQSLENQREIILLSCVLGAGLLSGFLLAKFFDRN